MLVQTFGRPAAPPTHKEESLANCQQRSKTEATQDTEGHDLYMSLYYVFQVGRPTSSSGSWEVFTDGKVNMHFQN